MSCNEYEICDKGTNYESNSSVQHLIVNLGIVQF